MLKINVTDLQTFEVDVEKFADSTINANTSGVFGAVAGAAEKAIVHATVEALAAYLEQLQAQAATTSTTQAQ